jgi:hypothetical protein
MEDDNAGPCVINNTPNLIDIKKEYDISVSNNNNINSNYRIIIEINNNELIISLKKPEDIFISHKKKYNLEEIKKISNVFSFHQDLSDVFEYLTGMLEMKTLHLNYGQNNENMYLSFYFEVPGTKRKEEIKLYLEKSALNNEEEKELIIKEIIYLKNEIKKLKEENDLLKKSNNIKDNDIGNNLEEIINILIEEKLQKNNPLNKDNNKNIEEIINILIEEKLKNFNLPNKDNNKNNDDKYLNSENEIKNLNELLSIQDKDNKEQFDRVNNKIKVANKLLNEIKNNNISIKEDVESLKTIINNIHSMSQEENQNLYKKINLLELKIEDNKQLQQEDLKSLQTIINEISNNSQEEIQSIRLMVNDLNNNFAYNVGGGPNQNDMDKFLYKIKTSLTEYQNKKIQIKLLFDTSNDGKEVRICHTKCNNIPNTFSIVTTTKGKKFGFFRSIAINGNGDWKQDNKAFFYSFDKNKLYKIKNDKNAVKFDENYYINTINFSLDGDILSAKYSIPDKNTMNLNFDGFLDEYEFTCGEKEFYVKKFEVYQLEISN